VLFAALQGVAISVTDLCGQQPPPWVALDPNPSLNSIGELLQDFQAVSWPFWCQCVPGTPPAINFPPPPVVIPPNVAPPPVFTCDPAQLCATLEAIQSTLSSMQTTLSSNYALTTLLQRYGLPFGVIAGAQHQSLSLSGQVSVPRLVGVQYQVDQLPPGVIVRPGVSDYIRDLGWIGLTVPSGTVAEHRVTRQQEFWLPANAQAATSFGWDLTPGTVISVRELYAEP
jgi:hypothetical protein